MSLREKVNKIVKGTIEFTHYQGDREWTTQEITWDDAVGKLLDLFKTEMDSIIGDDELKHIEDGYMSYEGIRDGLKAEIRAELEKRIK